MNKMNTFIKTVNGPLPNDDHRGVVYKINCLNIVNLLMLAKQKGN